MKIFVYKKKKIFKKCIDFFRFGYYNNSKKYTQRKQGGVNLSKQKLTTTHDKLRALCIEHGFTQQDMAELLGISVSSFNMKLNGKREFTITEIQKIVKWFGLPFEKIFPELFFENKVHVTKKYETA